MGQANSPKVTQPPKLLDRVRTKLRLQHTSIRTEEAYVSWIERFIRFHKMKHPNTMGVAEIEAFLNDLAVNRHVSASTKNQAFSALLYLYQQVLEMELPRVDALRARRPERIPVVLSQSEVRRILDRMQGRERLMVELLYGSGLRLLEVCRLRVKDVDFARRQLTIRDAKGAKDRVVPLPKTCEQSLTDQITTVRNLHEADMAAGYDGVWLPDAFATKCPSAATELGWQFVFPSSRLSSDPRGSENRREKHKGIVSKRMRHHVHESSMQKSG